MLRKILSFVIVLVLAGLIITSLLNLYNKSKLESKGFDKSINEKVDSNDKNNIIDKNSSSNKKKDKNDSNNSKTNSDNNSNNEEVLNNSSSEMDYYNVQVENTGSYKNNIIYIVSSIFILFGFGAVAYNKN